MIAGALDAEEIVARRIVAIVTGALGGAGCGVDTILIRHAREIEEHVRLKSWRHVATPREAVELVLALLP